MKSPNSTFSRRRRDSSSSGGYISTPDRLTYSRSSTYSTSSSSQRSNTGKNPVKIAAQSIAEAFVACFTPPPSHPENKSSSNFGDSDSSKARSDGSSSAGEHRRGLNRGIYATSNHSTHANREPAGYAKFTLDEIYKATRNFNPSLKIGQGGFGTVYKGRLDDGTLVAIKRAKKSAYDKHSGTEFQSEVRTLEKIEHLNLVKFYGFLEQGEERILVVEYVSNGTLREHLDCMHGNILDFAARLDIAIDVAHAVTYLHMYTDHPIIHRDIKSSNILLTENLRAKVADFGFARLAADSESGATHVSTQVKGTAGYLDPEYLRTYQLTEKSDVYSFGVLLVELVTGRRPIEPKFELKERITARWALKKFLEGDALLILDPRLERSSATSLAVEKILELSLSCVASNRHNRPTMRKCAEILWTIRKEHREHAVSHHHSPSSNVSAGAE